MKGTYRMSQIVVVMFVPDSIAPHKKFIVTNVMLVDIRFWRKLSRSNLSLTCEPRFSKLYAWGKV